MFDGFRNERISANGIHVNARIGGSGPGLVLLHGYPQTHIIWRHIAPVLAETFSVVVPDTRGYGDSDCPPSDPEHRTYSKRSMAQDVADLMTFLGHETFAIISHDRGARVGYRCALDHPERVTHYMSLDVVPTHAMWAGIDKDSAMGGFHWSFLAQPSPQPEDMIGNEPDAWLEWLMESWAAPGFVFDRDAMDAYKAAFRNPEVIRGTCEDYRAGATCDDADDAADLAAGKKLRCPVVCLWGAARAKGGPKTESPLDVWKQWSSSTVEGEALPESGHFIPEEAPQKVIEWATKLLKTAT